jgi:hypothetical protein
MVCKQTTMVSRMTVRKKQQHFRHRLCGRRMASACRNSGPGTRPNPDPKRPRCCPAAQQHSPRTLPRHHCSLVRSSERPCPPGYHLTTQTAPMDRRCSQPPQFDHSSQSCIDATGQKQKWIWLQEHGTLRHRKAVHNSPYFSRPDHPSKSRGIRASVKTGEVATSSDARHLSLEPTQRLRVVNKA